MTHHKSLLFLPCAALHKNLSSAKQSAVEAEYLLLSTIVESQHNANLKFEPQTHVSGPNTLSSHDDIHGLLQAT